MPAKRPSRRGYVWMQVPTAADVDTLRSKLAAKGPLWDQREYKLHRDRVIIYDPVVPYSWETKKRDPALRYMRMHLRISTTPGGPFELEYRRHTEQWWPLRIQGTIEHLADLLFAGNVPMTQPFEQADYEQGAAGHERLKGK